MYTYQFIDDRSNFQFIRHDQILDLSGAMALLLAQKPKHLDFYKIDSVFILREFEPSNYETIQKLK